MVLGLEHLKQTLVPRTGRFVFHLFDLATNKNVANVRIRRT